MQSDKYKKGDPMEECVPANETTKEIIKKGFDAYFGHVIELSDALLSGENTPKGDLSACILVYDKTNKTYSLSTYAGTPYVTEKLKNTITKAAKEGNYLYIHETFEVYESEEATTPKQTTKVKWTYTKQSDGNYYLLKAEKDS